MDYEDKEEVEMEYAPKGMFPEDDEDTFSIDVDEDLDVWNRGSGYTWGASSGSWWSTGGSMSGGFSSMWSTGIHHSAHNDAHRMLRHKKHIDSLCKIVDPTVAHTLEFASAGGSGYTDMSRGHIVVDGNLIKDDDSRLDVLSGLAIHEKLHVIHSQSLYRWQKSDEIWDLAKTPAEKKLLHNIANIIEDEYIERQLQKTCAGYVHYIDACKEHFFKESKVEDIDVNNFGELINTLLFLVRYPSRLDADRRRVHGKHIRVFMAELKTGIDSRVNTIDCIKNIYAYMMKQAKEMAGDRDITEEDLESIDKRATEYADSYMDDWKDDMSKKAWEEMKADGKIDKIYKEMRERRKKSLTLDMEDRKKDIISSMMDHDHMDAVSKAVKYESDYIDDDMIKDIRELEDSDYYEEKIDKNLAVSSTQRDVSWRKSTSNSSATEEYRLAKSRMKAQINRLKKKINLYGNTQKHNIYNQKRGILNKRQLHKIPMGMTDIFKATVVKEDKPLDICILVDESGSMGYHTMSKARDSAIAIKEALADNDKINLWIYGHSADSIKMGQTEMREYWSPSMSDRPFAVGGMRARCENRDGNAIISSALRVKNESDNTSNKLMLVLSDGSPSADKYRGNTAVSHTKRAVKFVEGMGWGIIQVGFSGAYEWMMEKQFTNYVYVDDTDKLGDTLSKIIRKVIKV